MTSLRIPATLFTLAALAALASVASAESPEEAAARVPLELYLKGHATGNGDYWRQAFHEGAKIQGIREGQLVSRTREEFAKGAPGKPADDEAQRKRRIASVDITGDAAVVKVELDYPKAFITDYLSMLKVNGEWKVVNKIFTVKSK